MHLVGGITGAAASLIVDTVTGLPSVPFTLMLDPGVGSEEIVEVTAAGGTTLTVTRGVDGTSAQSHTNGAEVRHAYSARDFQDSRNHEANLTTAHGVTGAVVGATNVQSLTNKTALAATAGTAGLVVRAAVGQTANILDVQDANGVSIVAVDPGSLVSRGNVIKARADIRANIDKEVLTATASWPDVVPIVATGYAGQAADLQQWKNSAGTVLAKIDATGKLTATGTPPAGSITMFGGASAPTGYLNCDGASVVQATYPALFAAIGTAYGSVDGTHFTLPNLTGSFPRGGVPGTSGGAATKSLSVAELASHTHIQDAHSHVQALGGTLVTTPVGGGSGVAGQSNTSNTQTSVATNQNTGSGTAFSILPPYIGVNFIIKT
jgi:microcystin-dependent protein/uncharacterized metal-binding protein